MILLIRIHAQPIQNPINNCNIRTQSMYFSMFLIGRYSGHMENRNLEPTLTAAINGWSKFVILSTVLKGCQISNCLHILTYSMQKAASMENVPGIWEKGSPA